MATKIYGSHIAFPEYYKNMGGLTRQNPKV